MNLEQSSKAVAELKFNSVTGTIMGPP